MTKIIKYTHYGKEVFVDEDLKGRHRDHCLCWKCGDFKPDDRAGNCLIANMNFALDVLTGIVTPVWECPKFKEM